MSNGPSLKGNNDVLETFLIYKAFHILVNLFPIAVRPRPADWNSRIFPKKLPFEFSSSTNPGVLMNL